MTFPSSAGSKPETLAEAMSKIKANAAAIKASCQQIKAASLSGPIGANNVVTYVGDLADRKTELARLTATPGLTAYAQSEYPSMDIVAEYNTMVAQLNATVAWIVNNFPKAPTTNELKEKTLDANGRVVLNTFTTASLAGFRTQLDALIATID